MATQIEEYRTKNGDNVGDPAYLNKRWESIDNRINAVENTKSTLDAIIADLQQFGVERIDEALSPVYAALAEVTDVGMFFEARSNSPVTAGVGEKVFQLSEADRTRFASPAYVAIMPVGLTTPAMLGAVVDWDREAGTLIVDVDRVSGDGITMDDWRIGPASATDNAEAAQLAADALEATITARNQANTYRGEAAQFRTQAGDFASAAQTASSAVATVGEEVSGLRDDVVAAAGAYSQVWLGAHETDPVTDLVGDPLVNGAAYLNTTDGTLKYYLGGGWTSVVVPVGSEVLTVFGRSANVVAMAGDYDTSKISRTSGTGGVSGATAEAAIADLKTKIDARLASSSVSAFILTVLDDANQAAALATLGALPKAGGIMTGALELAAGSTAAPSLNVPAGVAPTTPATGDVWFNSGALVMNNGTVTSALALLAKAQDWTAKQSFNINGTSAGLRIVPGAVPTTLADGDEWSTASGRFARVGGASRQYAFLDSPAFSGIPTVPTAGSGTNTLQAASTAFVRQELNNLVSGAPGVLDTLSELAAALGNDPNFSATITAQIGAKLNSSAVSGFMATLLDDVDQATARATLGLTIGTHVLAQSVAGAAIGSVTPAADRLPYFTGTTTAGVTVLSAFARTLLDDADQAAARTTLGLTVGTNVQAYNDGLTSLATLATTANRMAYTVGVNSWAETTLTAFARTLLDDADQAAAIATLGALSRTATGQSITGGANITPLSLGNLSGATLTINPGDRPVQTVSNNGAGSILPGSADGICTVVITNVSGAGAVTTTGWKIVGPSFDTTVGSVFICSCLIAGSIKFMLVSKVP